ncbi:ABC transporter ATP-binding protein [Micromonospora sp. NPDC001898]|uniref:ABC transporter ATP-binding protein n=1 Tax=Micromonospora sp. NPDC001898 TaxID=3364221 RepID=UPI0036B8EDD4
MTTTDATTRYPAVDGDGYVTIEDISFAYAAGAPRILADVSLSLSRGEFFVLLGPSGCGKTTVLNQVAGFEFPTEGRMTVAGRPVTGPGPDRAVIFQGDDSLLGWLNVYGNVEFGLRVLGVKNPERQQRVRAALEMVELGGQAKKYPHELSGGMKQRVQIARALVTDAPILLMDEPFGALDAQTRTTLQDELARIWAATDRTVLFITHDISEAMILGDRIGIMTSGPEAKLHDVIENPLSRPRERGGPDFGALYQDLERTVTVAKARRPGLDGEVGTR